MATELSKFDPIVAKWTTVDPIVNSWTPYSGMLNNPVFYTDKDGRCPGCPPPGSPAFEEMSNGQSWIFAGGAEYILVDKSLGADGWVRKEVQLDEVIVTPGLIQNVGNWVSNTASTFASSFIRVFSTAGSAVTQNVYMVATEGVHEGTPKMEHKLDWARAYYLDNWQIQSYELDVAMPKEQGLELMKSTSDVFLTVIPLKPALQLGSPIVNKVAPFIIDSGTKASIKAGRNKVMEPLYDKKE